jgi:putative redox protein
MPSEIRVETVHQGGMSFTTTARGHAVTSDYPIRAGDAGLTPLELVLAALASCAGSALAMLLRRAGQPFDALRVEARGLRRDEHPTLLTEIALEYVIAGSEVDREAVTRAIALSEERLCPVWALLRPGTKLSSSLRIAAPAATEA